MLLTEFIKQLQAIEKECRGTHHFDGAVEVDFIINDPTDEVDIDVELDRVDPYMLVGCGCWAGVDIILKVKRA